MRTLDLRLLDYAALLGYLVLIIIVSKLSYRKQQDTEQYHLAGKSMGLLPVLLSTTITFFSGVSFIGLPAWVYKNDFTFFLRSGCLLLAAPILIYAMVPFYHRLRVQTSYEYLERRFDGTTRRFASALFLLTRGLHIGIVIYATSLAVSVVTGQSLELTILLIGIFCTVYTMLGGMKSVVWTQAMQFLVLVGGILLIFFYLLAQLDGGISDLWRQASEAGKLRMFHMTLDPTVSVSFVAVIVGTFVQYLSMYGADQVAIQHYLTAKSMSEVRRAIWLQSLLMFPIGLFLCSIGALLWLFYQQNPERLGNLPSVDYVLVYFALSELPAGVPGLIFAGLMAATMAVTAGGLSGLSNASMNDFYRRYFPDRDDKDYVKVSKVLTVFWGMVATGLAFFVNRLGTLVEASAKINTFFAGILLGIFFLGMFYRRARGPSTLIAAVAGLAGVSYVGLFTRVSFFWYAPFGFALTLLVGYLLSRFRVSESSKQLDGLVYSRVATESVASPK